MLDIFPGVKEINLPGKLMSILDKAFAYCPKLENLTLPAECKIIGREAFLDCTSLALTMSDYQYKQNVWAFPNVKKIIQSGNKSKVK